MTEEFSIDLQQFIALHVNSIAQLEALLLLRREATRLWTADQVAKSLYIDPQMASALLAELARAGFVNASQSPHSYMYHVPSADTERLIGELELAYRERRVAVISMIYSKPGTPAQAFADAFRLRKES